MRQYIHWHSFLMLGTLMYKTYISKWCSKCSSCPPSTSRDMSSKRPPPSFMTCQRSTGEKEPALTWPQLLSTLVYRIDVQYEINVQVGKFLKKIKRAGQNRREGGIFFSKSINVQTKIRPCRGNFFSQNLFFSYYICIHLFQLPYLA